MEPLVIVEGIAAPIDTRIDTDQILPVRFLRRPRSEGYGQFLFHDLKFGADGRPDPAFILNRAPFDRAKILVGDSDFGTGSSREQAPWGLLDSGIRAVIAAGFGDIFYFNAIRSGLLPVRLPLATCRAMRARLHERPDSPVRVDLPSQTVRGPDGTEHAFEITRSHKQRLIEGLDDIGLTLTHEPEIAEFEAAYRRRFAWLFAPRQR